MPPAARIYRSLDEVPADFGPSVLTIGNFDGIHAGHRSILRRVVRVAEENNWQPSVLTFHPHPTRIVAPDRAPRLMTTPEQRCRLMAQEGVRQVVILPFTPAIAQLSPQEFAEQILAGKLGARAILVGDNFRFGHKQTGNVEALMDLGRRLGFSVEVIPAVTRRGMIVSSSAVRQLIEAGKVARAARLLERPYALEGDVVPGHGVGSKQTVPTLNLATTAEVLPARGVYITRTRDLDSERHWPSVTNIGYRPTFGGTDLSIETYLLAPLEGLQPQHIAVAFCRRLRDERKFDSPGELKAQIFHDVARAQAFFRRVASVQ